jgi:hypothetical protein
MLYIPVLHIDTNLINARQKLDAVNQLERWYADRIILIHMSGTVATCRNFARISRQTPKGLPSCLAIHLNPSKEGGVLALGDRVTLC